MAMGCFCGLEVTKAREPIKLVARPRVSGFSPHQRSSLIPKYTHFFQPFSICLPSDVVFHASPLLTAAYWQWTQMPGASSFGMSGRDSLVVTVVQRALYSFTASPKPRTIVQQLSSTWKCYPRYLGEPMCASGACRGGLADLSSPKSADADPDLMRSSTPESIQVSPSQTEMPPTLSGTLDLETAIPGQSLMSWRCRDEFLPYHSLRAPLSVRARLLSFGRPRIMTQKAPISSFSASGYNT